MKTRSSSYTPRHLAKDSRGNSRVIRVNAGISALAVTAGLAFALTSVGTPTTALASDLDVSASNVDAASNGGTSTQETPNSTATQSPDAPSVDSANAPDIASSQTSPEVSSDSQATPTNASEPQVNDQQASTSAQQSQSSATDDASTVATSPQSPESAPSVHCQAHVQDKGWQDEVSSSANQTKAATAGTTGQGKRVEAIRVSLVDANGNAIQNAIEYKAHVANQGWDASWSRDGQTAGTTGKSRAIEALKFRLLDEYSQLYDFFYRVHIQDYGWLDWTSNGDAAGSVGLGKRIEALQLLLRLKGSNESPTTGGNAYIEHSGISISSHVQNVGWQRSATANGQTSGTTGKGLRIEAISAKLGSGYDIDGGIEYRTYLQNSGWSNWVANGAVSGTTGRGLRVEAVQFALQGEIASAYDLYYRVHVANYGWMDWVLAGTDPNSISGTTDLSKRIEAIQLYMYKKDSTRKPSSGIGYVSKAGVSYSAKEPDGTWSNSANGDAAGTTGKSIPLVAMRATLDPAGNSITGSIVYSVHLANIGWVDGQSDGAVAGKSLSTNNIQGMRISLSGTLARFFDVYYRVHSHNLGWLGWAKDGSSAGTSGLNLPAEAFEITLVPKGNAAPGNTSLAFYSEKTYYGQPTSTMNASQARVRNSAFSTPATPGGYCAMWVTNVVSNAGYGHYSGDACDLYRSYCTSSDLKQLKVGMIIAVSTHPHTYAGSIYGHVGIYIGNGLMRDSVYGYVRQISVKDWIAYYGATVRPKWGWLGNIKLA